jgi:hypothetical protein
MPISPTTGAGISTGLGGLAGAFPDTSNTTQNTLQNSFSQNAFNTGTNVDIYNLMQQINDMVSSTYGTSNLATTEDSTSSVTPTLSPETQALLTQLVGRYNALSAPSLTGYGAGQTANINAGADAQSKAVENILASRGLSTSPAAATAQAGIQQNRLNQITGMQQQLPILQNQLNLANLAGATSFFSTIPKGAVTTGSRTGQQIGSTTQDTRSIGNVSQTGHQVGGTQSSGYGTQQGVNMGRTDTSQTSGGGVGGAASGAAAGFAAMLPYLLAASDKKLKKDIREIPQEKAIEKIRELKGRAWTWKGGSTEDSGVLAQEVQKVLPELVHDVKIKDMDIKAVNYAGLIPYLIGAVQNLDSRVSEAAH